MLECSNVAREKEEKYRKRQAKRDRDREKERYRKWILKLSGFIRKTRRI
jgi:hypothetical protein